MTELQVSGLYYYPIKSCAGTSLQHAKIGLYGIRHDREYMVIEKSTGMFVSQRSDGEHGVGIGTMCQILPKITSHEGALKISAPDMRDITVEPDQMTPTGKKAIIWDYEVGIKIAGSHINSWFTEFLSRERPGRYELVRMTSKTVRRAKQGFSQVQFADGYPLLVISQESLDDLNSRIKSDALPMDQFRPNIVISGDAPYCEDNIERMVINDVDLEGKTLCSRCLVTTTDQETGVRGKEPLATLAKYRKNPEVDGRGVVFGRNFNHLSAGLIHIGDKIKVLYEREPIF